MALLTPQQKSKKIPISLRFDESLLTQIKSYNEWVGIERIDHFFEQAARFVLEKDKDWQKKAEQFPQGNSPNQLE
jgi:hypothetical protein